MNFKSSRKEIVVTFLITGLITTFIVVPIVGAPIWLYAKAKYEAASKKRIIELRNQIMEETEKALDSGAQDTQTPGAHDNNTTGTGKIEWLQYKNSRYAFQISYLSNYTIEKSQNGDGVTLSKGSSIIFIYGLIGSGKNLRRTIQNVFPSATNIESFANDEAEGLKFTYSKGKYIIFKNLQGDNVVITSQLPDKSTSKLIDDIAFTYTPLSK